MKERPILFSAPMIRALLAGTKTQTRRIVKPQPDSMHSGFPYWSVGGYRTSWCRSTADGGPLVPANPLLCPYGQPGDRLWVRETFVQGYEYDAVTDRLRTCDDEGNDLPMRTWFRATDPSLTWCDDDGSETNVPWRPSIHMPRWASRITLEIKAVCVERLQEISETNGCTP